MYKKEAVFLGKVLEYTLLLYDNFLVNINNPAELILDLTLLESRDVVVELEGLRAALAVAVGVDGFFL